MCSCTQADRRGVVCHLVGRGCGLTRLCVLEANARFPTEYDSKGYGLMRLAGHTLRHWPVSSRPCERPALLSTASLGRPAFSRTTFVHATLAHTHNSFTRNFLTHNSFRLIHHYFATSSRTQLLHTRLFHPRTSHRSNTHTHNSSTYDFVTGNLSHTQLGHTQSFTHIILSHTAFTHNFITHNSSFLTYRSSTTSFVFPSFPSRFNFCFCLLEEVDLRLPGPLTDSLVTGSFND